MPTIKSFEELEIWQLSRELNKDIRLIVLDLREKREFELARVLEKTAGSIMDNIAEGFSRGRNREFIQFLSISIGSCGELKSQLIRCFDFLLLKELDFKSFEIALDLISQKSGSLLSYLKSSELKGIKFKG